MNISHSSGVIGLKCCLYSISLFVVFSGCATPSSVAPSNLSRSDLALAVLEWLLRDGHIDGVPERPAARSLIDEAKSVIVSSEFPLDAFWLVTDVDPRVALVGDLARKEIFGLMGYRDTVYVELKDRLEVWNKSDIPSAMVAVSVRYSFANAGAHRYQVVFWIEGGEMHSWGMLVGSS